MDVIAQLADETRQKEARDTLVAMGPAAVGPLLKALLDEKSPRNLIGRIEDVLVDGFGETAYDEVAEALAAASDEEQRRRASVVLSRFGTLDRYVASLAHPSANVRESAAIGIQNVCSVAYGRQRDPAIDIAPVIDALIPLMADPDGEVAWRAAVVLSMLGPEVLEPLRHVRRYGPGELRADALSVLATVGGEEALSDRDRAAVERLVRVKLPDDRPKLLDVCFNAWMAVPGGDRDGIAEALGLWNGRPATFELGHHVVSHDSHDVAEYGRVYVTPEVDGWTLVLGPWGNPGDPERAVEVQRLVEELSARYGRAEAHYESDEGGPSGWLAAADGKVVRRYLPSWEDDDDDPDDWQDPSVTLDPEWGVSPLDLDADTPVRGEGMVALTPHARHNAPPRTGAYGI
ncbi:HEAT repeat domain-containing protein [Streptomyces acidiscabies]|uniref:HEAT repeat protein n=1 Tax=Streptomyces acidiscabies TaxID=42234 RepID=A0A0L0KNN2_9ACTN|nr:HEAT repeat domain-containing protein [Streptomyces acidiscabies]KND39149.1 hypothetical protein IQ63_04765 [Streptomyces acidiscabies]